MRALVLLLVGLLSGALMTATAMSLSRFKQGTRPPAAAMVTMKYQLGRAREAVEAGCADASGQRQLQVMRALADDIEPLYTEQGFDVEMFGRHAERLRKRLDSALGLADDADCSERKRALEAVRQSCDLCHQDFGRG
jgi:hypothetical protein